MFHRYLQEYYTFRALNNHFWKDSHALFSNWPGHNIHLRTVYCSTTVHICCHTTYTIHHPDAHSFPTALVLKRNPNLTELYLRYCSIGDDATCELMEGVRDHPSLETLWLSKNPLGERGAISVAEMLERNKTLEELWLSYCTSLGVSGVTRLIRVSSTTLNWGSCGYHRNTWTLLSPVNYTRRFRVETLWAGRNNKHVSLLL